MLYVSVCISTIPEARKKSKRRVAPARLCQADYFLCTHLDIDYTQYRVRRPSPSRVSLSNLYACNRLELGAHNARLEHFFIRNDPQKLLLFLLQR